MRPPRPRTAARCSASLAIAIAAALLVGCDTGNATEGGDTAVDGGSDAVGDDAAAGTGGDGPTGGEVATEAREVLDGLLRIEVPIDWETTQDTSAVFVAAPGEDDVSTVLSAAVVPPEGLDDLEAALEHVLGDDDAETSPTVLPGAEESYRLERETSGGLWQRGVIARTSDGLVVLVVLAADAAEAPSDVLTDAVLDSVLLGGDTPPQAVQTT